MQKSKLFIFLFLFIPALLISQPGQDPPLITIQEESISIGKLFKEITDQSGYNFSFNSKVVDTRKKISFQVEEQELDEVLDLLSQTLNIDYSLIGNQIVLNFGKNIPTFFTLSGFLSDQSTGEDLISVSVSVKGTTKGTLTNEFGYYALTLEAGNHNIIYSYIGYEPVETIIDLKEDVQKSVYLPPSTIELPNIIVGIPLNEILNKKSLGQISLAPEDLNGLPELGGESGLVKGLQTLPGIKTHSDGSAFFYTRGGDKDQNVIFIDDAPIFNPSHLLGFYSLVIPDFTKSIDVYKSDMPASVGDRLSSVVNIRTKDGNLNKFQFSGALSPFVNRLSMEIPVVKKRSAMFVTFRRSNYKWLYNRAAPNSDFHFSDFLFKWNFKINDNNRLFFTAIRGGDFFVNEFGPVTNISWGNVASTLRWNHIFGPKLFSNTTIYSGNYTYTVLFPPNIWKSELGMISFKTDFTHFASSRYKAKFGYEYQLYFNTPGKVTLDSSIAILPDITSNLSRKLVGYYQGEFGITEKLKLNAGLRMTTWANIGPNTYYTFDDAFEVQDTVNAPQGFYNSYFNVDPRLSLQYKIDSTSQIKLSYGIYHQYLQLIFNSVSPFTSFEVWLPASPNIKPQSATQWSLSYLKYFEKSDLELSASAYYKLSQNQIDYEAHATTYLNPFLEGELRFGKAESYGLELMFKKSFGKLNGWVGYTYSRVYKTFPDLNNGETYRAFQDRPHDLSVVVNYQLAKRIFCSAYWTSYSGSTFTSPVGFYEFNDQTVPIYGAKNNDRLPNYNRLDFSFRFILNKETSRFKHSLTFSLYNALGNRNVYTVKFNKLYQTGLGPKVPSNVLAEELLSPSQIDLIRFFPSLTYEFKI